MRRPGLAGERGLALFLLALVLFNPPILTIFSADLLLFGVPLLYLYLFACWGAIILMIGLQAVGGIRSAAPSWRLPRWDR